MTDTRTVTTIIGTPYGHAYVRKFSVDESGVVSILSSKGWIHYSNIDEYNDAIVSQTITYND